MKTRKPVECLLLDFTAWTNFGYTWVRASRQRRANYSSISTDVTSHAQWAKCNRKSVM